MDNTDKLERIVAALEKHNTLKEKELELYKYNTELKLKEMERQIHQQK